jgi:hypothetical protein
MFHGIADTVVLAMFAVRKGEIAARWVPVKQKLPHITDEMANEVDDIVSKLVEKAKAECWGVSELEDANLTLHYSFRVEPAFRVEACRHETVEDIIEQYSRTYLTRASWVDTLAEDIWHAFND